MVGQLATNATLMAIGRQRLNLSVKQSSHPDNGSALLSMIKMDGMMEWLMV
jgi:hypothetical protein